MTAAEWQLDPRLAHGSAALGSVGGIVVRAMHTAPWPWLVLIPRQPGAIEWFDLNEPLRTQTFALALDLGAALKREFGADKLNLASLGNLVPQLHVHIVARQRGDPGWPGPIWGREEAALSPGEQSARLQRLRVVVLQVALTDRQ